MKTKLALAAACVLLSSACVSTSNQYRNDIVYRDGSYYSPADEQNGDYYYAPEQDDYDYGYDYGYYANAYDNYYYDSYRSPWYGYSNSRRCRFSYRYDRDCSMFGWGSSELHFGGFTLIISNGYGRRYGYDHGYYDYGYPSYGHGYSYGSPYYYSGHSYGYPYYGYVPRPRPHQNTPRGPVAMPKPGRPNNPIIDNNFNTGPGVRVGGEYVNQLPQQRADGNLNVSQSPRASGEYANSQPQRPIDSSVNNDSGIRVGGEYANPQPQTEQRRQNRIARLIESANAENANPYTRVRGTNPQPRPRPGLWNENNDERINTKQPVRARNPEPIIISNDDNQGGNVYQRVERRDVQPEAIRMRKPMQVIVRNDDQADRQAYRRAERQYAPDPQPQARPVMQERIQRAERAERIERAAPEPRVENNKGPTRIDESEAER